jgi:hypothetical protein
MGGSSGCQWGQLPRSTFYSSYNSQLKELFSPINTKKKSSISHYCPLSILIMGPRLAPMSGLVVYLDVDFYALFLVSFPFQEGG